MRKVESLTRAWLELEACSCVKLRNIESDHHYRAMVTLMNELLDKIGDQECHPLMGLLDVVTKFVDEYEEHNEEPFGSDRRSKQRGR